MTTQQESLKQLPQKALKQIRALCAGNGAERDSVQIKSANGFMIECEAINHLEIHIDTEEDQKSGRHIVGEMIENPAQIQETIKKLPVVALKNDETRKLITKTLLDRPDKGFSLHAEYFTIEPLCRSYSMPQPCNTCQGHGQIGCNRCGGRRQETCPECHGRTMKPCNYCNSSGFVQGQDGRQAQCPRCYGQRQIQCSYCRKTGVVNCRQCKGSGAIKCGSCKGEAFNTRIIHVIAKLKTLFEIDRASLPDPVTKIIEDQGDRMVAKGHIHLRAEPVRREDGGVAIQYMAVFPYGDLELTINGKPLKTHIFGYKGKLLRVPNFLDQLIDDSFDYLQEAANGEGDVSKKIRKSTRSRLVAKGLVYALTMPSKKAVFALKKKFPMGVSNEKLKDIIVLSKKALANVTRKTKIGGMFVGIIVTSILNATYFLTSVRDLITTSINNENIIMGLDLLLLPIGGFVGAYVSRYLGKRPLKKALGPLMPAKGTGQNDSFGWLNYGASALIFFATIYIAKTIGQNVPPWFPL